MSRLSNSGSILSGISAVNLVSRRPSVARVAKSPFVDTRILKKLLMQSVGGIKKPAPIVVYQTQSYITPECVGAAFRIYNGRKFIDLMAKVEHVGRRFGEFIQTRTFPSHMYSDKSDKAKGKGGKGGVKGGKTVKGGKPAPKTKR